MVIGKGSGKGNDRGYDRRAIAAFVAANVAALSCLLPLPQINMTSGVYLASTWSPVIRRMGSAIA